MSALIYQPDANAMQSGRAKSNIWILEFESHSHRTIDALTGWTGSDDTDSQVKMKFDTCARAERYAKQHGIEYTVIKKLNQLDNQRVILIILLRIVVKVGRINFEKMI